MNIAFIPVRGGSKSIPLKNIRPFCGKPLVYWTIKAACGCGEIDRVYVATDSTAIRETVDTFRDGPEAMLFSKVQVISRSPESASDTASTEFAMLEFAENYDFDNIVLIQATSPLLQSEDLDRGFALFHSAETDSVLSVVRQKRFHWHTDEEGFAHPSNYDVYHRPRRQDFAGYLVENGAFYITSRENLLKSQNRVSGNIRAAEMSDDTFFEIDEPSDWLIIEALMQKRGLYTTETTTENTTRNATNINAENKESDNTGNCGQKQMPEIKIVLTDCDGCLTDGGMYYSEKGDELKKFNTRDGMGFALLRQAGILTGILTNEQVDLNRRRAEKLKLDILEAGCRDKLSKILEICREREISLNNVCYIGDDVNDVESIQAVGWGCVPSDAAKQALEAADCVLHTKGGAGVLREVADMIIGQVRI